MKACEKLAVTIEGNRGGWHFTLVLEAVNVMLGFPSIHLYDA